MLAKGSPAPVRSARRKATVTISQEDASKEAEVNVLGIGINTITNLNSVNIYPNPANESLTISFGNEFNGGVEILNLNGEIVLKEAINSASKKLNISAIAKGMYILKITDINITQQYKLVVN